MSCFLCKDNVFFFITSKFLCQKGNHKKAAARERSTDPAVGNGGQETAEANRELHKSGSNAENGRIGNCENVPDHSTRHL